MKKSPIIGVALLVFCLACSQEPVREAGPQSGDAELVKLEKVYLESATLLPGISRDDEVQIVVKGNLPNPAYKIRKFAVDVKGTTIEITPLADYNRNIIAVQTLVPFADTLKVKVTKTGLHQIRVHGRNGILKREIAIHR